MNNTEVDSHYTILINVLKKYYFMQITTKKKIVNTNYTTF